MEYKITQKRNTLKINVQIPDIDNTNFSFFLTGIFAILLFLTPIFPDIKLTRPKLLLLETSLYALLFLWLAYGFYKSKIYFRKSVVTLPIFVYTLLTVIFYVFSSDKPVALSELKRSILSLTAFVVVSNIITSEKKRSFILMFWMFGSFFVILYGILQHSGGIWIIDVPNMKRVMSTFGNPIFFAAHIVISLPLAIGLFFYSNKPKTKLFLFLYFVSAIFALYYTKTRAAYLGFICSILIFSWLNIKSNKNKIIFASIISVFFITFIFLTKDVWTRHQAHTLIWRDTMVMWAHNPIIGTGPGTFHIYFPDYASKELREIWPQDKCIVNDAHNEYVQHLSETGLIGFGVFIWLIFTILFNAFNILKNNPGKNSFLISGFIASCSGILIQNFFSVDMRFIISAVYLFFLAGFIDTFNNDFFVKENIKQTTKIIGLILIALTAVFTFQKILKPYIAQKNIAANPDFFDEKILEPAKTINDLEELAGKYPDQSLVFEKLGWVYSKQKNWQKAIHNFNKAHSLNPNSAGPMNNLGNIYFLLGDKSKAIECWDRSLKINPNQIDSRLNLATAYYYNGQLKQAVDQIKIILDLDPKNEKAIVMLKQMTE